MIYNYDNYAVFLFVLSLFFLLSHFSNSSVPSILLVANNLSIAALNLLIDPFLILFYLIYLFLVAVPFVSLLEICPFHWHYSAWGGGGGLRKKKKTNRTV